MNVKDVLNYGHRDVMKSIEGLESKEEWEKIGVTPEWSIKDHLGHLAAYEHFAEDALSSIVNPGSPTPYIDKMGSDYAGFNDKEAALRKSKPSEEIADEYVTTHTRVMKLIEQITPEKLRETGTIPWYGADYSLDDFIVYANYGHIQGHVAEINNFRGK